MLELLAVGVGGFVGAIARYGLSGAVHRLSPGGFPWGTLCVNVLGCLAIGLLMTLVEDRQMFGPRTRLFVLTGFLGSLTTFSTFGHETGRMLREGLALAAVGNVAANVVVGLGAVFCGRFLARALADGGNAMKIEGDGQLLRVFVGESDRWQGKPLYEAIVLKARELGLAGATVLRGCMGFGAHSRVHQTGVLSLSDDLPVVVEMVDQAEAIQSLLPHLDEMVPEGMITVENVHIIAYRHGAGDPA